MAEHTVAGHTDRLVTARRLDSVNKTNQVLAALDAALGTGEPFTIAALARRAGVSRRFIYDHLELRAEAERRSAQAADRRAAASGASGRVTLASLRADLANAKATNHRLTTELTALRRRLGQLLGHGVLADLDHATIDAHAANGRLGRTRSGTVPSRRGSRPTHRGTRRHTSNQPRAHRQTQPTSPLNPSPARTPGHPRGAHLRATRIRARPRARNRRAQDSLQKRSRAGFHHQHLPARRYDPEGTSPRTSQTPAGQTRPLPGDRQHPGLPRQALIMPTSPARETPQEPWSSARVGITPRSA